MKILFCMRHQGYTRNFESTLRLLVERGHTVHVVFEPFVGEEKQKLLARQANPIEPLCEQYPGLLSYSIAPTRDDDGWALLGQKLRAAIDYLRYLEPIYRDAAKLRARARQRAPWLMRQLAATPLLRLTAGRRACRAVLNLAYRSLPTSPKIDRLLREHQPDIVVVTPLIEIGSPQADYIRSARAAGIRTALCVASWDNLTNKGLIHDLPDLVTVWNDAMMREAVELHGVPPSRIAVTGAPAYDHWFTWRPSTNRDQFCRLVGLRPDHPFVLYLCSSSFIAPDEASFVLDWVRQLRSHPDERLRSLGVLVRPHPQNAAQWDTIRLDDFDNVAVWPPGGADPNNPQARGDYYDSIFHSAVVVGINTSALIESAIVGRPVLTLMDPRFRDTQQGTLHFHHLLRVNGGLVQPAGDFQEHAAQLLAVLTGHERCEARNRSFLLGFVRPHGLSEPATPRVANAIEEAVATVTPRPTRHAPWLALVQLLFAPLAYFVRWRASRARAGLTAVG